MLVEFGSDSNVGRVREHNEDAYEYIHYTGGDVLLVCDGMGGHAAGDVASGLARATIAAALLKDQYPDPRELLYRALEAAHEKVLSVASASDARAGMGTTAVIALIRSGALYLGNVGDSRAYLVRDGNTTQLTRDQTRVQEMVDTGVLTEQAAKSHPDAGVLAQAIGQPRGLMPFVTPEQEGIPLRPEDMLILCTDGVYDAFGSQEFARLTQHRTAEEAAQTLVRVAVERDGQDNATAVVAIMRSRPVASAAASPGSPPAGRVPMAPGLPGQRVTRKTAQDWIVATGLHPSAWRLSQALLVVGMLFGVAVLAFLVGRFGPGSGGRQERPDPSPEQRPDAGEVGGGGASPVGPLPPVTAQGTAPVGRSPSGPAEGPAARSRSTR